MKMQRVQRDKSTNARIKNQLYEIFLKRRKKKFKPKVGHIQVPSPSPEVGSFVIGGEGST